MARQKYLVASNYGNIEIYADSPEAAKANVAKSGKVVSGVQLAGGQTQQTQQTPNQYQGWAEGFAGQKRVIGGKPSNETVAEYLIGQKGIEGYLTNLMKSQPTWNPQQKQAVEQIVRSKYGKAPTAPAPTAPTVQATKTPVQPAPVSQPTQQTQQQPQYTSLVDIYDTRPDLQKAFPQKGTGLDDWWNVHGVKEYSGTTLVQPGDPRISAPKTIEEQQGVSYSQLTEKDGTIYAGDKAYATPAKLATDLGIQPHEIDWSKIKKQEPEIKPIDATEIEGAVLPPDLPEPTNAIDAYTTSLTAQVDSDRKKVEDAYKTRIETTQRQIEASEKKITELEKKQEDVITGDVQEVLKPFREEKEKAERERLKIEENYFANQNSIAELESLLNQALSEITAAEGVTGLAAIRQPRINKIKEDYAARVGIIQAVMAARNNQIAVGNNLIDRTISAITADKNDQLNYYNTLLNFYSTQKDAEGNKLFHLKADEKDFLNRQIGLIENDLANSQATVNYIKDLMLDPETANLVEQSGVKLNDSIETIQAKFANFSYAQEVRDQVSQMSGQGYQLMTTPQMIADKDPASLVRLTDTHGTERVYYIDEDELLSPNEAATLGVAFGTTRGQATNMGITPARWKGTGGGDGKETDMSRIQKVDAYFNENRGEDGFISAAAYMEAKKGWIALGGTDIDFRVSYPPDSVIGSHELKNLPKSVWKEEEEETKIYGAEDWAKTFQQYKDKGYSREETENQYKSEFKVDSEKDIPGVIKSALDQVFGVEEKKGFWDFLK